ncbi:MAG: hypothetical protein NUV57_02845 [archaeon]|nr:hypothetical protein [archaeon]
MPNPKKTKPMNLWLPGQHTPKPNARIIRPGEHKPQPNAQILRSGEHKLQPNARVILPGEEKSEAKRLLLPTNRRTVKRKSKLPIIYTPTGQVKLVENIFTKNRIHFDPTKDKVIRKVWERPELRAQFEKMIKDEIFRGTPPQISEFIVSINPKACVRWTMAEYRLDEPTAQKKIIKIVSGIEERSKKLADASQRITTLENISKGVNENYRFFAMNAKDAMGNIIQPYLADSETLLRLMKS